MIPTFAEFWPMTTKIGRKELFAKRWVYLPDNLKIKVFEKVQAMTTKPNPETILNNGK
jgi:hypothetical protein